MNHPSPVEGNVIYPKVGLVTVLSLILLFASSVNAGGNGGGEGGGTDGDYSTNSQQEYNNYVAENACGCYSQSAVDYASSGGDVQSVNVQTPGYYGGDSGGSGGGSTSIGGVTISEDTAATYYDPRSGGYWSVDNVRNTSAGPVGTANYGGNYYDVTYSNYFSNIYGYDVWVVNDGGIVGGNGSVGSGSSDSSSGSGSDSGSINTNSGTDPTLLGGQGGHYEQRCTSSGKGGQTCEWVWVPDAGGSGICETYSCEGGASSFSGGGDSSGDSGQQAALTIDASPRLIRSGESSTISWNSNGAISCNISGPGGFSAEGTSGSQVAAGIIEQSIYTLTCQFNSGVQQSSATVNIIPLWREF